MTHAFIKGSPMRAIHVSHMVDTNVAQHYRVRSPCQNGHSDLAKLRPVRPVPGPSGSGPKPKEDYA